MGTLEQAAVYDTLVDLLVQGGNRQEILRFRLGSEPQSRLDELRLTGISNRLSLILPSKVKRPTRCTLGCNRGQALGCAWVTDASKSALRSSCAWHQFGRNWGNASHWLMQPGTGTGLCLGGTDASKSAVR